MINHLGRRIAAAEERHSSQGRWYRRQARAIRHGKLLLADIAAFKPYRAKIEPLGSRQTKAKVSGIVLSWWRRLISWLRGREPQTI